ncbi:J-type co-chaperone JAC1 mitochondrial [Ceratocystis platani]|uniref:J-type co-chaperone JAC1 mitochondrial n=1 Tax=Ceratocystis fimbriata f. sp. platani TaxID=88771 RepID=A0A0F8BNW5_CERFI|nr:J-type co-chaperone JAC1 mitochondrial [Ceratocystis platani]
MIYSPRHFHKGRRHTATSQSMYELYDASSCVFRHRHIQTCTQPKTKCAHRYLLGLRGINPGEDEQARVDDPALLMTVMEAHEQIQEAKMEADLKSLNEENEERIKVSENILEKAFKEDAIQAAVEESVRLRYWVNIRDSIHNWEPGKPGTVQH